MPVLQRDKNLLMDSISFNIMECIYSIIFTIRYFQYCGGWYIASFYAGRHGKILSVLASSHLNNSRDNPLATKKTQHKHVGSSSIFMDPIKWADELPHVKGTLLEDVPLCEKGSEPPLPQCGWNEAEGHKVYGSRTSALRNYLHTLFSPLENFKIHSYDIFHQCQETLTSMSNEGSQLLRIRLLISFSL